MTDIDIGTIEGTGIQIGNGNTQTVTAETAAEVGERIHKATTAAIETARAEEAATAPAPAPEPGAIEVAPAPAPEEVAGAKPLSIAVKISDSDLTFSVTVKRGVGPAAEVIETFEGLKADDFHKRIEESKFIVLNDALKSSIVEQVNKQRLLKAMAIRHAQIGTQFKETVVDPIRAYEAAKAQVEAAKIETGPTAVPSAESLEAMRVAAERAQDKLRVFGSVRDKNLGMRLAIMTRKERTNYWAEVRHAKGDRTRKHLANAKRKAKKARR